MFGRRRHQALQGGANATGYHTEAIAVGDPDVPNRRRVGRLFAETNLGMQGHSGEVVGYDRGDPAHTLSADLGLVAPGAFIPDPITAQARLGIADQITLSKAPSYAEVPSVDAIASGDSYKQLQWARLGRRR